MIELRGVSKYYQNEGNVTLGLRKASLKLNVGEFVTITGESGSGKSTLLNVISGLDKYDEGEYFVNGEETSYFSVSDMERFRKEYVGFVFQNYNIIDSYTVYENVIAALVIQNYDKKKRKSRALELIDAVGLSKQRNQKTSKLSGGQKQRVVIARALAKDSPIIVADEPTGNLDTASGEMVMHLLKEISKDKLVIVVTHNYEQAEPFTTRRIHMADGEIIEDRIFKPAEPNTIEPTKNELMGSKGQFYFASLNVLRQPKKTITMLLAFIVLMVAVIFVYASSFTNLSFYNYHPLTNNIYDTRVIVKNKSNAPFTTDQLDTFLNYSETKDIVHYDMVQEVYYRLYSDIEGDYRFANVYLRPISSFSVDDIEEGSMPTLANQILLSSLMARNGYRIGDQVYLSLDNSISESPYPFEITGFHKENYDIVGVSTDFMNQTSVKNTPITNSYFIESAYQNYFHISLYAATAQRYYDSSVFVYSTDVPLGEIQINGVEKSAFLMTGMTEEEFLNTTILLLLESKSAFEEIPELKPKFINEDPYKGLIKLNPDTVKGEAFKMSKSNGSSQITLVGKDAANATKLYNRLSNNDAYLVMYPSVYKAPNQSNPFSFLFLILMFIVFGFAFVVINIITKNIYRAKNKDIAIMRSIGASKGDVRKIYFFEQILTVSIAFSLALIIVRIIEVYGIKTSILTYLGTFNVMIIYVLFLILGLYIIFRYLNKLFGRTVISTLKGGSEND